VAIMYIGSIAESDYPALREICNKREFPRDFAVFRLRIESRKRAYRARGFIAREIIVDVAGFKRRRRPRTGATYRDLDRYAARLVYRKQKRG